MADAHPAPDSLYCIPSIARCRAVAGGPPVAGPGEGREWRWGRMVTLGEQLQLSRRISAALHPQRNQLHSVWLRTLRDIPRDFGGKTPEAHLEEFAYPTIDALIAYLDRGDRRASRRLAVSWAMRQDGLGVGLGESIRAILSLGPAVAPLLRRLGLDRGQSLVESFLAMLAEELSRTYAVGLKRALAERAKAIGAAEERLLSLQM